VAVLCPDPLESLSDPSEHLPMAAEKNENKGTEGKGEEKKEGRKGR